MTDNAVTDAAAKRTERKVALAKTTTRIRERLDPRLLAADVTKLAMANAIAKLGAIETTPRQRKKALVGAGVAAVATVGLRVAHRNSVNRPSPALNDDVIRPE